MKRNRAFISLGLCTLALAAPAGANAAATITVEQFPSENKFLPRSVVQTVSEGTFTWIWGPGGAGTADFHDVVHDGQLFDSGEAVKAGTFEVVASAGSFSYFCSIHFGMVGRIAVRPEAAPGFPGPFRVRWATAETATGKRYDVRYKLEGGRWRSWHKDTKRRSAIFNPDNLASSSASRAYLFQVNSENSEQKASNWSPTLRVGSSG